MLLGDVEETTNRRLRESLLVASATELGAQSAILVGGECLRLSSHYQRFARDVYVCRRDRVRARGCT